MKKFVGYYIIGASSRAEAKAKKGLVLWTRRRPDALRRYLNRTLLGIYWIDEEKELVEKSAVLKSENGVETELQRFTPVKTNNRNRKPNKNV